MVISANLQEDDGHCVILFVPLLMLLLGVQRSVRQKQPILSNCIDERRLQMLLSNGMVSTPQLMCPKNQELQKEYICVADTVEPIEQCPILDDYVQKRLELSFPWKNYVSLASHSALSTDLVSYLLCGKNIVQSWELRVSAIWDCVNSSNLVRGCWWVLIGIIMSCLCLLWRSQKQKLVQGHPAAQRKQLQHFVQGSSNGAGRWRKKLLVIFVSLGIIGSVWLFWHLNMDIMQRREEMLAKMCDERARMLQDQFNVSTNHVHALTILVSTFHHGKHPSAIDQSTAFERPLISGVAYALKVLHSDRMHFEKQHGWTIKKMETKNEALFQDCIPEKLDPAPIQDEYAPVIFAQETVSHIVSIDMMSGKDDCENILRARASGKGVLTSPFKLLKSNHLGVVLTIAVYNNNLPLDATPEQRIEATVGMVTQLAMILIDKDAWDKECSILYTIKKHRENGIKGDPINLPKVFLLVTHLSPNEHDELKSAGVIDDILMKPLWLSSLIHSYKESIGSGKKQVNGKKLSKLRNLLMHKQILVVDDNAVNRRVAEGVLQRYGAIVIAVESGRAALKMLKPPHNFAACFMDLQMPEMDGFEATRQIRHLESEINEKIACGQASAEMFSNMSYWHILIRAMTADATQDSNEECSKCGMDGYVSKPFEEEQLYMAMARFFKSD
ncbi:Histidine kinase 2 [Spatholobus suberectus]|nr:Histidine kinase 2 [Spatholobus suberectus]